MATVIKIRKTAVTFNGKTKKLSRWTVHKCQFMNQNGATTVVSILINSQSIH